MPARHGQPSKSQRTIKEEMLSPPQSSFDDLLAWLDSDRNKAGEKYETIRTGLIRVFVSKGFNDAEDLADEAINRVMVRLPDIKDDYIGEQSRYFQGVARNIVLEARRRPEIATEEIPIFCAPEMRTSDEYEWLIKCLQLLPASKRDLILDYYLYQGHDKIEHHRRMARELAISEGALRNRAHNIRASLEKCVLSALGITKKQKVCTKHRIWEGADHRTV